MRRQRGVILVAVLVAMAILLGLSSNYLLNVSRETEAVDILSTRVQPRYSAFSGVNYAMYAMQDPDIESRWQVDGRLYSANFSGGEVYVRILSESGRVDINRADQGLLILLFQYAGVEDEALAEQLADNVLHWRNNEDAMIGQSVSDADYVAADLPVPQHRPFLFIEEFAQVYGVTPSIYRAVQSLITVYGGQKIDAFSASDAVLALLELDEAAIEEIHQFREAYYNNEVVAFESTEIFGPYLAFGIRGRYYRVQSYAIAPNGQSEAVYAVVRTRPDNNGAFQIVDRGIVSGQSRQAIKTMAEAFSADGQE